MARSKLAYNDAFVCAKVQRDVPISSAFRSLAVKPREERFDRRSLGVLGGVYGEVRLHADRRIRAQHRL